jgi:hypothetical protein
LVSSLGFRPSLGFRHLVFDGERLLFTSSRTGFKDEALYTGSPQPYGKIFVMNCDGTHVEQLTDDQWEEGGPAWQPHHPAPTSAQAARK